MALISGGYLLDAPAVAVGVPEEDAPNQVEVLAFAGRPVGAVVEDLDLAHVYAPLYQIGAGGAHVRDDQENAVEIAGLRGDGAPTQVDGTGRPWRGQLDQADLVADPVVYVHREAHLLRVEFQGAVQVRYRDRDHFDPEIHVHPSPFRLPTVYVLRISRARCPHLGRCGSPAAGAKPVSVHRRVACPLPPGRDLSSGATHRRGRPPANRSRACGCRRPGCPYRTVV